MRRVLPVILLLTVSPLVLAARSVPHDQPVAVRLEAAQPTAVVLPEPVASVSLGVAKERFSLDYDGPYLFLQALDPTVAGRLFVVGQSGKLYTVLFRVGTPADDVVSLVTPPTPVRAAVAQPLGVSTYLRALKTSTALPGQTPADLPPPVIADARLTVTGTQVLAWGNTLGLVVALQNTSPVPLTLDLRVGLGPDLAFAPVEGVAHVSTWGLPPRLTVTAVAADDEVLSAGASTRVYWLMERRP